MLTNKKLRTLLIALPAITLMACSSGPSDEELEAERQNAAAAAAQQAQQEAEAAAQAAAAQAEAAAAEQLQRAQQMMEQEKAELESQQTVYFDFDRATIKSEFFPVLRKHAEFLVKNPGQTVVIEGHTDSRGTPEYNIALGERRAKAVETFFQNEGVSASQISVVSYGEEKPSVTGTSEYAFAQNRRAVVVYQ
ncbi:peptidoglycan-associated lipoprotein Pal [Glaciecola sp. XM2]|jgi:peptidoglycan-associated lipoprotein|uniref:peptidoglycan-associated lipoprotein Pal n=1 Tax=Glaciecola sp. XM2 TaxID=1914931 RepID=UPI001BDDD9B9|nr:peptidoglycan-associated lipoprotein Pal [Glaciecola sp. XM2]MBT1450032.1 peptidoglycan-associated lipoprotein Pal [Glaciecola sp. XM2]